MWIFTITAGRTGTAWLTELVGRNLKIDAVHEHLGVDDIGTQMPDIRVMRNFNTYGMNQVVESFWSQKISRLPADRDYFEANHTLAKAGLVEALAARPERREVVFVLLRRNWVSQILSFRGRNDFTSMTVAWQWYLLPTYPRRIVNPAALETVARGFGAIVWYVAEMEARQEYYRLLFGDQFRFIDAVLDEITTQPGAKRFLTEIGFQGTPTLPEKINAGRTSPSTEERAQVEELVARIRFDAATAARIYVESGQSLSA